jgi:hypothetical protein
VHTAYDEVMSKILLIGTAAILLTPTAAVAAQASGNWAIPFLAIGMLLFFGLPLAVIAFVFLLPSRRGE